MESMMLKEEQNDLEDFEQGSIPEELWSDALTNIPPAPLAEVDALANKRGSA